VGIPLGELVGWTSDMRSDSKAWLTSLKATCPPCATEVRLTPILCADGVVRFEGEVVAAAAALSARPAAATTGLIEARL